MLHIKKSIRIKDFDYTQAYWYYVTICIHVRGDILGRVAKGNMIINKLGKIVENEWLKTKSIRPNVEMDYFIIMPDHLHGIISLNRVKINCRGTEPRAPKERV